MRFTPSGYATAACPCGFGCLGACDNVTLNHPRCDDPFDHRIHPDSDCLWKEAKFLLPLLHCCGDDSGILVPSVGLRVLNVRVGPVEKKPDLTKIAGRAHNCRTRRDRDRGKFFLVRNVQPCKVRNMLRKIISGMQTGADQGGLFAAEDCGLETGGEVPAKAWTEDGSRYDLVERFGMTISKSYRYDVRTAANVKASDGTVIFGNVHSAGSRLTRKLCDAYDKPCLLHPTQDEFKVWLKRYKIEVLNVAGNRESVNQGIFAYVRAFLVVALFPTEG